jgi:2-polyprenyl-3-methyl-5-hydroxy-6-metoxy-1,4-benzoquinol methylase
MPSADLTLGAPRFEAARRSEQTEWLDRADLNEHELAAYLHDLARLNAAMLGHWPLLRFLRRAMRAANGRPLTVLDVGCGHGDLLRAMRRWSRRNGVGLRLIGVDLNKTIIDIARQATPAEDGIDYRAGDVFTLGETLKPDVIVSSLLTHHFSDAEIVSFLRWMEKTAARGWAIYDLQRSVVPYVFLGLTGHLVRLHPMVIHDGRISVTRSLTMREWRRLIAAAGIAEETICAGWFLYRVVLERMR